MLHIINLAHGAENIKLLVHRPRWTIKQLIEETGLYFSLRMLRNAAKLSKGFQREK